MSKEKVDRYKQGKSKRVKEAEREKLLFRLEMSGAGLFLALLIGWFSYSVYANHVETVEENREGVSVTMNVTGLQDYLSDIQTVVSADSSEEE